MYSCERANPMNMLIPRRRCQKYACISIDEVKWTCSIPQSRCQNSPCIPIEEESDEHVYTKRMSRFSSGTLYTCDQFFSEVHCPRLLAYSAGKPMKRIAAILDKIIPKQKHPTLFQTTRMIQARGTKHQHQTCQAIVKSKQSSTLLINHWNKQERGTIHHDQDQRLAIVNNSTH